MNKNLKKMIMITIYVALALVLDFVKEMIPFLNMPQGGSINIALIPIVILSFHFGVKEGMMGGMLWWLISSILGLNKWFVSVPQYVVDYILPSVLPGMAAMFYRRKNVYEAEAGILTSMLIRTLMLVISGAYFWPDGVAAGSAPAWTASLAYNLPYSIATTVILMIVVPLLLKTIDFKRYTL